MSESSKDSAETYIKNMRSARASVAVLKYRLVTLRAGLPITPIFAFEGIEDKIVYHIWAKRIRPALDYEPFPCFGKKQVFKFYEMVQRDLSNLSDNVYFFIDRDFDDMAGHVDDSSIFMTDMYSVENYLVSDQVVIDLLKNEFQCHADLNTRQNILDLFIRQYSDFLSATRDLNWRIFLARFLNIEIIGGITENLDHIAQVKIDSISPPLKKPADVIKLAREPSVSEIEEAEIKFMALQPKNRYRGKFALMFFEKWLGKLVEDYSDEQTKYFIKAYRDAKVRQTELVLGSFAAKSEVPLDLSVFLHTVALTV